MKPLTPKMTVLVTLLLTGLHLQQLTSTHKLLRYNHNRSVWFAYIEYLHAWRHTHTLINTRSSFMHTYTHIYHPLSLPPHPPHQNTHIHTLSLPSPYPYTHTLSSLTWNIHPLPWYLRACSQMPSQCSSLSNSWLSFCSLQYLRGIEEVWGVEVWVGGEEEVWVGGEEEEWRCEWGEKGMGEGLRGVVWCGMK